MSGGGCVCGARGVGGSGEGGRGAGGQESACTRSAARCPLSSTRDVCWLARVHPRVLPAMPDFNTHTPPPLPPPPPPPPPPLLLPSSHRTPNSSRLKRRKPELARPTRLATAARPRPRPASPTTRRTTRVSYTHTRMLFHRERTAAPAGNDVRHTSHITHTLTQLLLPPCSFVHQATAARTRPMPRTMPPKTVAAAAKAAKAAKGI